MYSMAAVPCRGYCQRPPFGAGSAPTSSGVRSVTSVLDRRSVDSAIWRRIGRIAVRATYEDLLHLTPSKSPDSNSIADRPSWGRSCLVEFSPIDFTPLARWSSVEDPISQPNLNQFVSIV
ncbi:hypothetical protein GWI33_019231 [Rhynchophorus ferrugineus]|uniref:Uncharacterized protein n=1 Tax=Rhynchophorus ferrugineus TaxID=354439 RepID=A0A834HV66_RHYFE|nr:hypothetical protein GWI33_019231 [Rhynchophorus ferrugineus]